MSQITCCPFCQTHFKVVPDQLRISEGWVRCGHCKEVFDATAHLQQEQAPPPLLSDVDLSGEPPKPSTALPAPSEPQPASEVAHKLAPGPEPDAMAAKDWGVLEVPEPQVPSFLLAKTAAAAQPEPVIEPPAPLAQPLEADLQQGEEGRVEPSLGGVLPFAAESVLEATPKAAAPPEVNFLEPVLDWSIGPEVPASPTDLPAPEAASRQAEMEGVGAAEAINPTQVLDTATEVRDEVPADSTKAASDLWQDLDFEPPAELEEDPDAALEAALQEMQASLEAAMEPPPAAPALTAEVEPSLIDEPPATLLPDQMSPDPTPLEPPQALQLEPIPTWQPPREPAWDVDVPEPQAEPLPTATFAEVETSEPTGETNWSFEPEGALVNNEIGDLPEPEERLELAIEGEQRAIPPLAPEPEEHKGPVGGVSDRQQELEFVKRARRQAFWRRPVVRASLGLLALLLSLILVSQWALHERDTLAARVPALRPALQALCAPAGCTLHAPRDISKVVIDSSSFVKARQPAQGYQLGVGIKNLAAMVIATPALELTLTNAHDDVVLRRALHPHELGAPPELAPEQTWRTTLDVEVSLPAQEVAGYRIEIFYP